MIKVSEKHTTQAEMCAAKSSVPHICKGKDIRVQFPILKNGQSADLTNTDLRITLMDDRGMLTVMPFTTSKNIVSFVFEGIKQKRLGYYSIRLWENFGKKNQCMLDMNNLFALVASTEDEYIPVTNDGTTPDSSSVADMDDTATDNAEEDGTVAEPGSGDSEGNSDENKEDAEGSENTIETTVSGIPVTLGVANISLADAKSAYDAAVEHGYDGTENDFGEALASLGQCFDLI